MNPLFYKISTEKEICKRHIQNALSKEKFASTQQQELLPNILFTHSSHLIKKGKGIDPVLQYNKVINIELANRKMNRLIIRPGESFSFWKLCGKVSRSRGFKEGRVIKGRKLISGLGGGLCNLANTIHLLVLHSPLDVTEIHMHSDALAPDPGGIRIPFSAGTSVGYNYIDYRFKNNTDQNIQLCIWVENEELCGEIRSEKEIPWRYEITEEDHHFHKEGDNYYRISKIYRDIIDKESDQLIKHELIWDNHSKVMFDHDLIPKELIR